MSRRILSVRLLGIFPFAGVVVIGREWQLPSATSNIHREQGEMLLNVPFSLPSSWLAFRQR